MLDDNFDVYNRRDQIFGHITASKFDFRRQKFDILLKFGVKFYVYASQHSLYGNLSARSLLSANEGQALHGDTLSFLLSHQPHPVLSYQLVEE